MILLSLTIEVSDQLAVKVARLEGLSTDTRGRATVDALQAVLSDRLGEYLEGAMAVEMPEPKRKRAKR
jgi:hypothetical protein